MLLMSSNSERDSLSSWGQLPLCILTAITIGIVSRYILSGVAYYFTCCSEWLEQDNMRP